MELYSADFIADEQTALELETLNPPSVGYLFIKRLFDIILSSVGIILTLPLFLVIVPAIRLTSKGKAIYTQKRLGLNGKEFTIYKFRSMVEGADNLDKHLSPELLEYYKKYRKIENDPRITKVGRILRKTSLDELPQIYNIFLGNMSIVGPRPMLPEEKEMYGDFFNAYITMKPGLTGYWQIKSRTQTTMEARARLDYEYLKKRSLLFDLKIMVETVAVVLSKKGAC